jgi:hypothetical protein
VFSLVCLGHCFINTALGWGPRTQGKWLSHLLQKLEDIIKLSLSILATTAKKGNMENYTIFSFTREASFPGA